MIRKMQIVFISLILLVFLTSCVNQKGEPSNYFNKKSVNVDGLLFTVTDETVKEVEYVTPKFKQINFILQVNNTNDFDVTYYLGVVQVKDSEGNSYGGMSLESSFKKAFSDIIISPGEVQYLDVSSGLPLEKTIKDNELTLHYIRIRE